MKWVSFPEKSCIVQKAPLGDPLLTVAGYNLSLRLNEAENVLVEEYRYALSHEYWFISDHSIPYMRTSYHCKFYCTV